MLHISEENGNLKCIATLVDCLPTKHYLSGYSHANFRHKTLSPQELFRQIAQFGVNQHFAIVTGNVLEEIRLLAEFLDFDCHIIP